jgi:enoyl-CoA hydratase/carnithine racemase
MNESPVLFEKIKAENGKCIGVMTLNVEKKLNTLTLEMVRMVRYQLSQWIEDETIACVLIKGAGDRAFCAGGDVQELYYAAVETPGGPCLHAEAFLEHEYRMDYLFHVCHKPVIAWGHDILMGGGLGIFAGCSHRVVTENIRMAMPELMIALLPDVGAGWFLNKMPSAIGMFLALTGVSFNAADALHIGIADYFLDHAQLEAFIHALKGQDWSEAAASNHEIVGALLNEFLPRVRFPLPTGNIEAHQNVIYELCSSEDGVAVVDAISAWESNDTWMATAKANLLYGSPLSALVTHRYMRQARSLSLKEVFQAEMVLAVNLVRYPDFAEGVRALLIEKDKKPKWQCDTIHQVPQELLDQVFQPPWSKHPLADL